MTPRKRDEPEDPLEKTGYRLPRSVVALVREAVGAGEARSQNEFVERALRRELREVERRRLYHEYARAAADADFMADMAELAAEFELAVGDGLVADENE